MNWLALIKLTTDAAGKQAITTTLADDGLLYEDYQAFKAGKLKLSTLPEASALAFVQALARETALLAELMNDPTERGRIMEAIKEINL